MTAAALLGEAECALYDANSAGRNRVMIADDSGPALLRAIA